MDSDLDVFNGNDSNAVNSFTINETTVTISDALDAVDGILKEDDSTKLAFLRSMLGMQKVSGISLAKLLHEWEHQWDAATQGQPFADFIFNEAGLSRVTVTRYCNVWEMYAGEYVPKQYEDDIMERPVKDQIVIATAIAQGHEFDADEWRDLTVATNNNEVRAIVMRSKGQPPRKNSMSLVLERDGTLNAWNGSKRTYIGSLAVDDEGDDTVKKAIHRIVSSAGITRK